MIRSTADAPARFSSNWIPVVCPGLFGSAGLRLFFALSMGVLVANASAADPLETNGTLNASAELANPHLKQMGIKECQACHSQPGFLYPKLGVTQFVRLTEAVQWNERDKHAYAYELVRIDQLSESEFELPEKQSNRRARDMHTKLGWKQGDNQFERKCLSCHAGTNPQDELDSSHFRENLIYGVQCEACHGAAEKYLQTTEHQQPTWRAKSPEEKAALGMTDLSNAAICAEVCLSCHLGNIQQGRFISHDMYAAGHPPLPPFELQTFLDAMPPHWGTIHQKPYENEFAEDKTSFQFEHEYLTRHFTGMDSKSTQQIRQEVQSSFERTKRSMVGAMVSQSSALQLVQDAANQPASWGDYSLFDCMGCHQTLYKDRSRYRPEGRVPGRPFPPHWSSLSDTALEAVSPAVEINTKLNQAFNKVPFGDREKILQDSLLFTQFQSDRRKRWIGFSKEIIDSQSTREWLIALIDEQSPKLTDYWVAKQTAWIATIVVRELIEKNELEASRIEADLDSLHRILHLDLNTPQKQSVLTEQGTTLQTAQSFDVEAVRYHLDSISNKLQSSVK
jgi:hypothetical protein